LSLQADTRSTMMIISMFQGQRTAPSNGRSTSGCGQLMTQAESVLKLCAS